MAVYKGAKTKEISFPLGGIGTGSIGLAGNGRLLDWEIFNKPAKGSINGFSHIAVRAVDKGGRVTAKALNGDLLPGFMGQYEQVFHRGFGYGPATETMAGFPHFKDCTFDGEFPVAKLSFCDDGFPGPVTMTAFNPMIPLDDFNSSLPAAFFEIEFSNPTNEEMTFDAAFSVMNPFARSKNKKTSQSGFSMITMHNEGDAADSPAFGDLSIATDSGSVIAQEYWYRGIWKDGVVTFWREFASGASLSARVYDEPGTKDMCTLMGSVYLRAGEKGRVRFVLSWNIPNNHKYWSNDENERSIIWKNYYATLFRDSLHTAAYCLENYSALLEQTLLFKNSLFSSTLDVAVIDAVSSTLSVLKSPTVLRLSDGSFYGWEGVQERSGSCEGTCAHVWNYAYALCFLFPNLERSIRELEFRHSLNSDGKLAFRLFLPLGYPPRNHGTCVDGQMGAVIKAYREWKLSGNNEWLKENWKYIKKTLEYAWSPKNHERWDADKDGVLEGRQHHTLDMELFGPSSWLEGFYLAALKAAAQMAEHLGFKDKAAEYLDLFDKGYKWTKENLFNGKYFFQKIDLKDKALVEGFGASSYWNDEAEEIKYQIGEGCAIDQMCAQWHANICGLGDIFDERQRKTALKSLYENNFKPSMREFTNPWRIFSLNDESGAVICDYPQGTYKPVIPIPYCEEAMHGFEYQLAGLLISEGMIEEGLTVVRSVRDRYDGEKRNPWNEFECGSNYARSMACFALIPIFSGFIFDLPQKTIGFNPPVNTDELKCFWCVDGAWGMFELTGASALITVLNGSISLEKVALPFASGVSSLAIDGEGTEFDFCEGLVSFKETKAQKSIEIKL